MSKNERREYIVVYECDGDTMFDMGTKERIVRCRDCKRIEYCRFYAKDKDKPNGFCAWGERREP